LIISDCKSSIKVFKVSLLLLAMQIPKLLRNENFVKIIPTIDLYLLNLSWEFKINPILGLFLINVSITKFKKLFESIDFPYKLLVNLFLFFFFKFFSK